MLTPRARSRLRMATVPTGFQYGWNSQSEVDRVVKTLQRQKETRGKRMPSQEVKALAYTLDPACWVSYSGKPRAFKAAMDERRNASMQKAQDLLERHRPKKLTLEQRVEELERRVEELERKK